MSLLQIQGLSASYGSAKALFGVDIEIAAGEVLALMGRNGVGKTTTVHAICGMLPSSGGLRFDGLDLHPLPSHKIARLGVGLVPEGRRCFRDLSVRENLIAAARPGEWTLQTVAKLFPKLEERKDQRAASLSGGEQQMLAIGRALMTNPRLLILDEATEGLAPIIRQEIWTAIATLKKETGLAIMVIDKSVKELAPISDSAVILEKGMTVWSGAMADMTKELSERYIGI